MFVILLLVTPAGRGRHFARRHPCILAADERHPVSHHCRCDQRRLAQVQEGRDLAVGISSGARVREYEQYLAPARWDAPIRPG
jgi:hypothetical protein